MAKFIGLVGKLLNVNKGEWSRVSLSWFINLFYRVGFVVGWTIIVGMFVGRYGVLMLPVLFIVNGLFSIVGSFFYSTFIDRISKERTIFYTILASVVVLFAAILAEPYSEPLFFGFLLVAEAVFLVQLKIVANGFVEDLFTPLESERTFPVIESSETIGGIIAGLLVASFANVVVLSSFIYIWGAALLLMMPALFYYNRVVKGVYRFNIGDDDEEKHGLITKLKEAVSQVRHVGFVRGLFFVVLIQWIFANLIEFQYTRAVSANVSSALLTSGSGFEHALVHDLGALFILFSVVALIFQLFAGSRLITSLGIVGSMMLYPVVMILSVFGLTIKFGLPTAVLAQANKNITGIIHLNAYHNTYYSIKEHFREHTREFLEGIVRPVGAVIGTLVLIGLQKIFVGEDLILAVNLSMIAALIMLFMVTYGLQGKYTKLACYNLTRSEDKIDKIEAIDILSQKGHKSALPVLRKVLYDPKESDYIKIKILKAFGELQEYDAINDIIKAFESNKADVRMAAIESLLKFRSVRNFFFKNVFYEYQMIEALKKLYQHERNEEIRSLIIYLLSKLNPVGTFGFLIKNLKRANKDLKGDIILALGQYKDDHVIEYVEPYLHSTNPTEKAAAIISLWKYPGYLDELELELDKMISSKKTSYQLAAIHVIGELKIKFKIKKIKKFLDSSDHKLKIETSLALAKVGNLKSVEAIVDLIFDCDPSVYYHIQRSLKKMPAKVQKAIEKEVKQVVSKRINKLLVKTKAKSLNHLDTKSLKYLKMLYSLVEENEEVELINELLYANKTT